MQKTGRRKPPRPAKKKSIVDDGRLRTRAELVFLVVLVLLLTVMLLRTAWVCEDAYITFRTVDNFIHGYGLTWNTDERVQAYTHPFWMFLVSLCYFFTSELFCTVIVLSILLTLGAVLIMLRIRASVWMALASISVLAASKSFVDYATSGLETPLSFLLFAVFFVLFFSRCERARSFLPLVLVASLATFNRMDTALLYAAPLGYAAYRQRKDHRVPWKTLAGQAVIGSLPLTVWMLFSLFYYGFPFPNTAYAKLGTGIAPIDLAVQGLHYLVNSLVYDPVTLVSIVVVSVCVFATPEARRITGLVGIWLYVAYVVKIGGDFMSGRFLALPLFASAVILASIRMHPVLSAVLSGLVVALSFNSPHPTFLNGPHFSEGVIDQGIADERGFYFWATGLLREEPAFRPEHPWIDRGTEAKEQGRQVVVRGNIGLFGYYAGPKVHIVDYLGLSDPLIARMQIPNKKRWRIGHFVRAVPDGYVETIESGRNQLKDPHLRELYDRLSLVTRGPIWSVRRLAEIAKMNIPLYNHLESTEVGADSPEPGPDESGESPE